MTTQPPTGPESDSREVLRVLDLDGEGRDMVCARLLDAADRMANPSHRGNSVPWPEHARMLRDLAAHLAAAEADRAATGEREQGLRVPAEWSRIVGVEILDHDGWRGPDAPPWHQPIDRDEFMARMTMCTVRDVPATPPDDDPSTTGASGLTEDERRALDKAAVSDLPCVNVGVVAAQIKAAAETRARAEGAAEAGRLENSVLELVSEWTQMDGRLVLRGRDLADFRDQLAGRIAGRTS